MHNNSWFLYAMALVFLPIIALHKAVWWSWREMGFDEYEVIPRPIGQFEWWLVRTSPKEKIGDITRYPKLVVGILAAWWAAGIARKEQPSHEEAVKEALEDQEKYGIPPSQ